MSKIKYIHCFGTSHTAGGGFEFDSNNGDKVKLKTIYKELGEKLTQFNFSWPGQLQKFLKNKKIKVINHAKSGFGNELMYRKTFEIISDKKFKKDENLFIYEFSYIGRKEYYLNSLEDYIIVNYGNLNSSRDDGPVHFEIGNNYFYDNKQTRKKIDNFLPVAYNFFKEVIDEFEVKKEIDRNNSYFYNFLVNSGVNFLLSSPPDACSETEYQNLDVNIFPNIEDKMIKIQDGEVKVESFLGLVHMFDNYSITNETKGRIVDHHLGLRGNKLVAKSCFNKLVDLGIVDGEKFNFKNKEPHINLKFQHI